MADEIENQDVRPAPPRSATHILTALAGLLAFIIGNLFIYFFHPFNQIVHNAITLIFITSLGIFMPDLCWQRISYRASAAFTEIRTAGSWHIALTKFAGLVSAMGFVALLYWVFPEYNSNDEFYQNYWVFLAFVLPPWLVLAPFYFYLIYQWHSDPKDSLWHLGKMVTGQWQELNVTAAAQQLLGWIVKGFFFPLMFIYFCDKMQWLLSFDFNSFGNFQSIYDFLYSLFYYMEIGVVCVSYFISLRITDTHIRSSDMTMLGWVVALICYEPFWSLIGRQYLSYDNGHSWVDWLGSHAILSWIWGVMILCLIFVYAFSSIAFGGRFSNLTNRGIITSGPYRFTKHPAYITKNISWWLISMPFMLTGSWAETLRHCLGLLALNGVYFLRAKTEERHLSSDPAYVEYAAWISQHGALRWVNRVPLLGDLARWQLKDSGLLVT